MKKFTTDDPETRSADIVSENVAQLKVLFPDAVADGEVNLNTLKALLGCGVPIDESDERYGLNWFGKRQARRLALTPSTGTLRPLRADSVDWDTTQNLVIEGDNLEVLKLLQKSYSGKVKLIYIDPPYNTGKDFVYADDYRDNLRNYLEATGQVDGGRKLSTNAEGGGRFHTAWLNMMLPRLRLARTLLREDGVLLVSVDDHECANLRGLLAELFGEENSIGTIVWKGATDNNPTQIAIEHEYVLCFGRSKDSVSSVWQNSDDDAKALLLGEYQRLVKEGVRDIATLQVQLRAFIRVHRESLASITHYDRVDERGVYTGSRKVHNPKPGGYVYDVVHPATRRVCAAPVNGYRYPEERMRELEASGRILYGDDETQIMQIKEYLDDYKGKLSSVFGLDSRTGANELNTLFGVQKVFSNPKPTGLLRHVFDFLLEPSDVVLDFFAGSGSTGHAVWQMNQRDGGNRRFILVQLPQPLDPGEADQKVPAQFCDAIHKPRTIAELTKERLRRAATKIAEEAPMFTGDLGFRVFRLATSNIQEWAPDRDDLPSTLEQAVEHIRQDRSEEDILYELLLKLGLDLCVSIEDKTIAGRTVYSIGGGTLLACLSDRLTADEIEPIGLGMVEWHEALAPAGDTTCVFRDSAFADDVAKTNLAAILQQHGLQTVRSL